jgi:uncharacterized protein (TIGR03083 family)
MDTAALYADTRGRITELVRGLSPEQLDTLAPAAPEWRVRDIVCHLSGVVADVLAGNLDGIATDAWTGAQVHARRDKSVDDVLAEWGTNAPQLEAIINGFGSAGVQAVMDTVTHEHDIRGAVNQAGARDSDAADASLQWLVGSLGEHLDGAGGPALRLTVGSQEWVVGPGEPAATVAAPSEFDLMRALIGRRSVTQVANWKWDGEAGPYLGLFAPWGLRATDLVE